MTMTIHSQSLRWASPLGLKGHQHQPDLATAYISLLLLCYPFTGFFPGIKLSEMIYFDSFRIAVLGGIYFLAINFTKSRANTRITFNRPDRVLIVFLISLSASIIWSVDKIETLRQLNYLFYAFLFYIICLFLLRHEKKLYKMSSCFLWLPFLYCIGVYLYYQHYGSLRPPISVLGEEQGVYGSFPNFISAAAEITVPFLLVKIIMPERRNQLVVGWLSLLGVATIIIISESRGSILAVIFMVFLFSYLYLRRLRRFTGRYAIIIIILGLIVGTLSISPILEDTKAVIFGRFEKLRDVKQETRYALYLTDIQMIKNSILVGYGYGTHDNVAAGTYDLVDRGGRGFGSHDIFVDIWQGAGIPSLAIFLYLIYYLLKNLKRMIWLPGLTQRQWLFSLAVYVALAGSLFHALFRPLLDNPNFYLLLAMSSVILKNLHEQKV